MQKQDKNNEAAFGSSVRYPCIQVLQSLIFKFTANFLFNSRMFTGLSKTFHAYTAENYVPVLLHDLFASHHEAEVPIAVSIL